MRRRALVLAVQSAAIASACGGAGKGPADPNAIVVAPTPGVPSVPGPPEGTTLEEDIVRPLEVSLGQQLACIRASGKVRCSTVIGEDGVLGGAVPIEGIEDAVSLSVSDAYGCAALRGGAVHCFGDNTHGQLGAALRDDRSARAVAVRGLTGAKRVYTADRHACALLRDGTVRCWGNNESGQTGGSTHYRPNAHELVTAVEVPGVKDVVSLALGTDTTCATLRSRDVTCWGRALPFRGNAYGNVKNQRPQMVPQLREMEQIAAAETTMCGIKDGEVQCWGDVYGLVSGDARSGAQPVTVGVRRAKSVKITRSHGCAVLLDGAVSCWGSNHFGALGRGEPAGYEPLEAEVVRNVHAAADIVMGPTTTCIVSHAREVYCFGMFGQKKQFDPVKMRLEE